MGCTNNFAPVLMNDICLNPRDLPRAELLSIWAGIYDSGLFVFGGWDYMRVFHQKYSDLEDLPYAVV